MVTAIRQYLVILAIALWLGGFTFYALVVVPHGGEVRGGSLEQGFVTRLVTVDLNWIGLGALAILLWNVLAQRGKLLTATWLGILLTQLALFAIHPRLDAMLDPTTYDVASDFHFLHEIYLWIAAIQWGLGLAHIGFVLAGNRREVAASKPQA
jgi:hypothetical protein